MKSLKITLVLLIFHLAIYAQSEVLEVYVQQALTNNEMMKQQDFNLQKATFALKEANGLFSPNVNLQANYVASKGGRTIDIPIGDLVNPVYSNLNQINSVLAPGSPQYPQLENVSEQLNPNNFYNAYLRTSMPLLNAEIWYNRKIKQQQVNSKEIEKNIFKRELAKNVKVAYFNYLAALQAVNIYKSALLLVKESERINTKLYENGKEVPYAVSKAKSEVSKIESQLAFAVSQQQNAAAFFNFLLNQPLETEIIVDNALLNNILLLPDEVEGNSEKREELLQLQNAKKINATLLSLNKSYLIPKLNAQLDLGSQAFNFQYNQQSRYYLLGIAFDWSLFSGLRNTHKKKQTELDIQTLDSQTKYITEQLKLAATTANNTYAASKIQYNNSKIRTTASNEYFSMMEKKYKQGTCLFIEYIDAQNDKIIATLQQNLDYFNAWIKLAELERTKASLDIQ